MAVQTRILQLDIVGILKELSEITKNPELIEAAHSSARKQIALTQSEKQKVKEARAFIDKHNELEQELQNKQKELDNAILAFTKHKENLAAQHEQEVLRLNEATKALEEREKNHYCDITQHKQDVASHTLSKEELEIQKTQIAKTVTEHEKRLQIWEADLLKKEKTLLIKENQFKEKEMQLKAILG